MPRKNSILFKPYMSRACLDRVKTQTRRLESNFEIGDVCPVRERWYAEADFDDIKPSLMKARMDEEKRSRTFWFEAGGVMILHANGVREYYHDGKEVPTGKARPSIHIPDIITRQTIVIESVRVEPLLNISDDDAIAEGIRQIGDPPGVVFFGVPGIPETRAESPRLAYFQLWDLINGPGHHKTNPKVYVFGFTHWPVNFAEVM